MRTLMNYCFLEVQTSVASWSMHTCVHDWTFATLNKVVDKSQYWYAFDCVGILIQEDFDSLAHVQWADLTAHALRLGYVSDRRGEIMRGVIEGRLDRFGQPKRALYCHQYLSSCAAAANVAKGPLTHARYATDVGSSLASGSNGGINELDHVIERSDCLFRLAV
jgi:hypothetical protein